MKYIEEFEAGDGAEINGEYYVVSSDFKSNGQRMCISLTTGFCRYFKADTIANSNPLYILDKDSNLIPIKPTKKTQE